jgi:hypothetical protein
MNPTSMGRRTTLCASTYVLQEGGGLGPVSLAVKCDHRTESVLLLLRQLVLRMGRQPGIHNPPHGWMGFQKHSNSRGVASRGFHPQVQSLQASMSQEAIERRRHSAHPVLDETQLRVQVLIVGTNHAHYHITEDSEGQVG